MKEINAEVLIDRQFVLGEGVNWDSENKKLRFVDIENRKIYEFDLKTSELAEIEVENRVGFIVNTDKNSILAGVTNKLIVIDNATREQKIIKKFNFKDGIRFNDGKCDPAGRLIFGTMAVNQEAEYAKDCGELLEYESNKDLKVLKSKMAIPNGLAFSKDNKTFYHIDTATQEIRAYPFDLSTGNTGEYETVIKIPEEYGSPDGMCIDENDNLWVALWGGYKVCCVDTKLKKITEQINVNAKYVSCCCFGGENLDELFITSAMDENNKGGELYHAKLDVKGTLPYEFRTGE